MTTKRHKCCCWHAAVVVVSWASISRNRSSCYSLLLAYYSYWASHLGMRILSRIVRHYIGTNNFSTKNIFNIYIWCFIFSFEIYQWTDLCIIKCGQSTSPPENQSIARNSSSNWDKRLVIAFTRNNSEFQNYRNKSNSDFMDSD